MQLVVIFWHFLVFYLLFFSLLIFETSKSTVLFQNCSGLKLNFPETLSLTIYNSLVFSLSLGCFNAFVFFFFNLSLWWTGTCFTNITQSSFLVNCNSFQSLRCTGTCLIKTTSSSISFAIIFLRYLLVFSVGASFLESYVFLLSVLLALALCRFYLECCS